MEVEISLLKSEIETWKRELLLLKNEVLCLRNRVRELEQSQHQQSQNPQMPTATTASGAGAGGCGSTSTPTLNHIVPPPPHSLGHIAVIAGPQQPPSSSYKPASSDGDDYGTAAKRKRQPSSTSSGSRRFADFDSRSERSFSSPSQVQPRIVQTPSPSPAIATQTEPKPTVFTEIGLGPVILQNSVRSLSTGSDDLENVNACASSTKMQGRNISQSLDVPAKPRQQQAMDVDMDVFENHPNVSNEADQSSQDENFGDHIIVEDEDSDSDGNEDDCKALAGSSRLTTAPQDFPMPSDKKEVHNVALLRACYSETECCNIKFKKKLFLCLDGNKCRSLKILNDLKSKPNDPVPPGIAVISNLHEEEDNQNQRHILEICEILGSRKKSIVLKIKAYTAYLVPMIQRLASCLEILDISCEIPTDVVAFNTSPKYDKVLQEFREQFPLRSLKKIFIKDYFQLGPWKFYELLFSAAENLEYFDENDTLPSPDYGVTKLLHNSDKLSQLKTLNLVGLKEDCMRTIVETITPKLEELLFVYFAQENNNSSSGGQPGGQGNDALNDVLSHIRRKLTKLSIGNAANVLNSSIVMPKMERLESLRTDSSIVFNNLNFADMPNLKFIDIATHLTNGEMTAKDWERVKTWNISNLTPSTTVEKFNIFLSLQSCQNPNYATQLGQIFPNAHSLTFVLPSHEFLKGVWTTWVNLTELELDFRPKFAMDNQTFMDLDDALFGITQVDRQAVDTSRENWWTDRALQIPLHSNLASLKNLQWLTLKEERITAKRKCFTFLTFFGVLALSKMKRLKTLTVIVGFDEAHRDLKESERLLRKELPIPRKNLTFQCVKISQCRGKGRRARSSVMSAT